MLVSHRYRFIYTKTMKTAGTSVESYFEPLCMAEGEWKPTHARETYVSASGIVGHRGPGQPADCRWWNHMPASSIRVQLGEALWSSYFKFCVVRNPYERAVSYFYYWRAHLIESKPDTAPDPVQFERWLEASGFPDDRQVYTIDGRVCMDRVIRYECLAEDLREICDRLAVAWEPGRLPSFKAGVRPSWATLEELYTPRSEEIVRNACAFELRAFGYRFGPAPSPTELSPW